MVSKQDDYRNKENDYQLIQYVIDCRNHHLREPQMLTSTFNKNYTEQNVKMLID
jgi:hypothetical protein